MEAGNAARLAKMDRTGDRQRPCGLGRRGVRQQPCCAAAQPRQAFAGGGRRTSSRVAPALPAVHALRHRRGAHRQPLLPGRAPAQRRAGQSATRLGKSIPARHDDVLVARHGGLPRSRRPPGPVPATPGSHSIPAPLLVTVLLRLALSSCGSWQGSNSRRSQGWTQAAPRWSRCSNSCLWTAPPARRPLLVRGAKGSAGWRFPRFG